MTVLLSSTRPWCCAMYMGDTARAHSDMYRPCHFWSPTRFRLATAIQAERRGSARRRKAKVEIRRLGHDHPSVVLSRGVVLDRCRGGCTEPNRLCKQGRVLTSGMGRGAHSPSYDATTLTNSPGRHPQWGHGRRKKEMITALRQSGTRLIAGMPACLCLASLALSPVAADTLRITPMSPPSSTTMHEGYRVLPTARAVPDLAP